MSQDICISNHMFKREIWDKFTEISRVHFFEILKFQKSETREISKFQKMNEVNFPKVSRINI